MKPLRAIFGPAAHPLDIEGDRLIAESIGRTDKGGRRDMGGLSTVVVTDRHSRYSIRKKTLSAEASFAAARPSLANLAIEETLTIMAAAKLTDAQAEVLILRAAGATWEQIGAARGTTKQGAMNVGVQGLKKIARTRVPLEGLREAYREDVSRGRHSRRPRAGVEIY